MAEATAIRAGRSEDVRRVELSPTFEGTRTLYSGRVGLLPTLGFFHEGHLALMDLLRAQCDTLVVSLFVNPTQFNDPGDFDAYPRDLERDAGLADEHGVDILFVPDADEVYPEGWSTIVEVGRVSQEMEGRHRPGHFIGVATVVAKLFAGLRPDVALFGRKDAQQLAVLRAMARDLRFPVEIVDAPVVREPDGLALEQQERPPGPDGAVKGLSPSAAACSRRQSRSTPVSAAAIDSRPQCRGRSKASTSTM